MVGSSGDHASDSSEEEESPVKKAPSRGKKTVKKEPKTEVKSETPAKKAGKKAAATAEKQTALTPAKTVGNGIIPAQWRPGSAAVTTPSRSNIIPGAPEFTPDHTPVSKAKSKIKTEAEASPARGRSRRSKENGIAGPSSYSDSDIVKSGKVTKAKGTDSLVLLHL